MKLVLIGLVMIATNSFFTKTNESNENNWSICFDVDELIVGPSTKPTSIAPKMGSKRTATLVTDVEHGKKQKVQHAVQESGKIKLSDVDPKGKPNRWFQCGRCEHVGHHDTIVKHMHTLKCAVKKGAPCLNCPEIEGKERPRFSMLNEVLKHNRKEHLNLIHLVCWICGTNVSTKEHNFLVTENKLIEHVKANTNTISKNVFKGFEGEDIKLGKYKVALECLPTSNKKRKIMNKTNNSSEIESSQISNNTTQRAFTSDDLDSLERHAAEVLSSFSCGRPLRN